MHRCAHDLSLYETSEVTSGCVCSESHCIPYSEYLIMKQPETARESLHWVLLSLEAQLFLQNLLLHELVCANGREFQPLEQLELILKEFLV